MEVVAHNSRGFSQFASFDLTWGDGNRFFSKDHKALLIIAEPRQSAVDYKFAEQVGQWTREHIQSLSAEPAFRDSGVRATAAGAYVYAEQDHKFIERNIRRISLISIIGNLLLCLLIYPRIPLLILSLLPTSLGILWTTGVASFYPGEVNSSACPLLLSWRGWEMTKSCIFLTGCRRNGQRAGRLMRPCFAPLKPLGLACSSA